MVEEIQVQIPADDFADAQWKEIASQFSGFKLSRITGVQLLKKSIDARKKRVMFTCKLAVYIDEEFQPQSPSTRSFQKVHQQDPIYIIGAGPAGLFAALRAVELGMRPIVLERGKDVRLRRRDIALLNKEHIVNPESNYCYGEGGAGTYSDGKLYTRSKKRGDVERILDTLIQFGANSDIKINTHPHVGTNKLPQIISSISECIRNAGGEVRFEAKMTDLLISNNQVKGIVVNGVEEIATDQVLLATGHSARDIYRLLNDKGVLLEPKSFAVGVRIEHPRELIDKIQYHGRCADDVLPPASYSLVQQVDDQGVFSFCMCPGGIIAPCATSPGEVVTNGWSPSKRNNAWSNSGLVVSVHPELYGTEPLDGLRFQEQIERAAWEAGGKTQTAPAQRVLDFIHNRESKNLPNSSYLPGIVPVNLHTILPEAVAKRLAKALKHFEKKMPGYLHPDAILVGVETRTSSPLRIPREKEGLEHPILKGLYPCAEGAGYAGGIVSAAMDGERCVEKMVEAKVAKQ